MRSALVARANVDAANSITLADTANEMDVETFVENCVIVEAVASRMDFKNAQAKNHVAVNVLQVTDKACPILAIPPVRHHGRERERPEISLRVNLEKLFCAQHKCSLGFGVKERHACKGCEMVDCRFAPDGLASGAYAPLRPARA